MKYAPSLSLSLSDPSLSLSTRVHAEENKRRTLQRSDIATAISKTDMCDFLIDIVPREEAAKVGQTRGLLHKEVHTLNHFSS